MPIVAPGPSGCGASAGPRRIPSRYSASCTKSPLWTVYRRLASPSGAASTIRRLAVGVRVAQRRIGAQRVPEPDLFRELVARGGHDVQVDPEGRPVVDDDAEEHRAGRRERRDPGLALEPEREERVGQLRDVARIRLDAEVHVVLAREAGHRRAADVLDLRPGPRRGHEPRDLAGDVLRPRVPAGGTRRERARSGRSAGRTSIRKCRVAPGAAATGVAGTGRGRSVSACPIRPIA